MSKKLLYPTWKYKSRKGYVAAKGRQFDAAAEAINKLYQGSAWLPKKVRENLDNAITEFDKAYGAAWKFQKRISKKLNP